MFDNALHFCFDNHEIVAQYSLHTAQAWFRELYARWPFTPGSHTLRLQCVCGT